MHRLFPKQMSVAKFKNFTGFYLNLKNYVKKGQGPQVTQLPPFTAKNHSYLVQVQSVSGPLPKAISRSVFYWGKILQRSTDYSQNLRKNQFSQNQIGGGLSMKSKWQINNNSLFWDLRLRNYKKVAIITMVLVQCD